MYDLVETLIFDMSIVLALDPWALGYTGPDGAVAMSSAHGLVGTGFASRYRLQKPDGFLKAQWVGVRPLQPLLSR